MLNSQEANRHLIDYMHIDMHMCIFSVVSCSSWQDECYLMWKIS